MSGDDSAPGKCQPASDTMSLNATKAGMEGLDVDKINAIIKSASKGSKFYQMKEKNQKKVEEQVQQMKDKISKISDREVSKAQAEMDQLVFEVTSGVDWSRTIVHVDMDAFYAAVHEKDDPELRNVPMAVGSMGMLSTSNYKARKFGVRAGMPGFIGKKLCPELKLIPLDFEKYRENAAIIREIFATYDQDFSPMSWMRPILT